MPSCMLHTCRRSGCAAFGATVRLVRPATRQSAGARSITGGDTRGGKSSQLGLCLAGVAGINRQAKYEHEMKSHSGINRIYVKAA